MHFANTHPKAAPVLIGDQSPMLFASTIDIPPTTSDTGSLRSPPQAPQLNPLITPAYILSSAPSTASATRCSLSSPKSS
ncbi:hypothetical protein DOTSEDRAFT_73643 [Dothistroma septosporum NZE10]|uniref:Uncharacterized protein n=1 Tax=Dothistroma septosporum (strain NZE10 / CBS 128990) TaxID=675120 RepID=N1PID9_DOTSN|nr:hypothetical protein DOTSEDRAFT_73643 [Dothistroma septosporum NZE10]